MPFIKPFQIYSATTSGSAIAVLTVLYLILATGSVRAQPAGYGFAKIITIDASEVSGNSSLTDFPVMIRVTDNDLRTTANGGQIENSSGYDIYFTQADCTTALDFEIESYNASTGEFVAWVRIPSLPATVDYSIGMFYGNSSISANPSTTSTWNSNYIAVYHLNDDFLDATSNNNDGTNYGSSDISGQMGDAQDFDGSNDYIQTPSRELQTENNFTISAWFNSDDVTRRHILWQGISSQNGWGTGGASDEQEMHLSMGSCCQASESSNLISCHLGNDDDENDTQVITAQTAFTDVTNWHFAVATFADLSGTPTGELFLDGTSVDSDAGVSDATTARNNWDTDLRIGRPGANQRYFDGIIDEVRISKVVLSDHWIATEYNNQSTSSTFYSMSSEMSPAAACSVLPIQLLEFEATAENNQHVRLNWTTATEINNDFFTIERSKNLTDWEEITQVPGAGYSTDTTRYNYLDRQPYYGESYYLLKQTDFDGHVSTSEVRNVTLEFIANQISMYPNPADKLITITAHEIEDFQITIYNPLGQQLQVPIKRIKSEAQLDASQLPSGVYLVYVVGNQFMAVERIVVKH